MVARPCAAIGSAPDALVYRKKALDLDSPQRKFINRILTGLRYSCDEAGGIIEDLDFDWGALLVALSLHRPRQSCGKSCRSPRIRPRRTTSSCGMPVRSILLFSWQSLT
jgi:hypothetical protein